MRNTFTKSNLTAKIISLILSVVLFYSATIGQTVIYPTNYNCPSNDLELRRAAVVGTTVCVSCTIGQEVTRDLKLTIWNRGNSLRTSFAFWGYLVERTANNTFVKETLIDGCGGPIIQNNKTADGSGETSLTFPNKLTYTCGNSLTIERLVLAWTDASGNDSRACPLNPQTISPKCGELASIAIDAGLNPSFVVTNGVCTNGAPGSGSVNVTVQGGKTPYSFLWSGPNSFTATTEDVSGLAAGTYTCVVKDANNCEFPISNIVVTVPTGIDASAIPTNGACVSGSPTNGSIALTVTSGTASSFEWTATNGGPIPAGQADDEDLSNLPTGTYAVKVNSADGCYKNITGIGVLVPIGINATAVPTNGTCGTNGTPTNGSIALTVTLGTASSFAWSATAGGPVPAGKSADEDLTDLPTGTYSVLVTNAAGCYKAITGLAITVPTVPNAATICKIEPGLCGPATGTINVLTPAGTGYEYSKNGGTNWQTSTSFTGLAAGSSPSILVKNSDGCWSAATVCSSASVCAPEEKSTSQTVKEVDNMRPLGSGELEAALSVRAMPNPFSNQVRFMIKSAYSGIGSLDIYNMQGQKVKNVYTGYIRAGSSYFDLKIADNTNTSQLIYVLSINGERVTGKLLRTTR